MIKKITLLLIAVVFALQAEAQITLSHNTDNIITSANSVACPNGDNQFARHFVLADFGITDNFTITSGEIGIQSADGADVTVNVWEVDAAFPLNFFATGILLGSQVVTIPNTTAPDLLAYTFDTPVVVPAGTDQILVEIAHPEGTSFFIGGTADETDDSWIYSIVCSLPDYGTAVDIGFPDAHYYITVTGDSSASVSDTSIDGFSMYPNPVENVLNLQADAVISAVTIYNMLGQEVVNTSQTSIDMSNFPSGSYILKVHAGNQVGSYNFIKE